MFHTIAKPCILALTLATLTLLMAIAAQAQATLTIPDDLPISPAPSGGCIFTPGPINLTVVCSIVNLNPNKSHDFVIAVHPTNTAPRDVTAVAHEDGGGTATAFITSNVTEVGLTEMQVTLASTNPGKVGVQLVYKVTVPNIQDDDARDVFALLALPKNVTFVSASRGCVHAQLTLCKMGQMSPGVSKTVTITVLPNVSGWTQATAGVRLSTPDANVLNNSAASNIWVNL